MLKRFMQEKFRKNFFVQHVASYCIVLIIPLVTLTFFTTNFVFSLLQETLLKENKSYLVAAMQAADRSITPLTDAEQQQYLRFLLQGWNLKSDPLDSLGTQEVLSSILRNNDLLSDIVYISESEDYVLTAKSTVRKEHFSRMYQVEGHSLETLLESPSGFFPELLKTNYLGEKEQDFFVYCVDCSNGTDFRKVFFLFDTAPLLDLMKSDPSKNQLFYIVNPDGTILCGKESAQSGTSLELSSIDLAADSIDVDGTNYFKTLVSSEDLPWSFVTLTPMTQLFETINQLRAQMVIVFSLTVGICFIAIIFFSLREYLPVKQLFSKLSNITETDIPYGGFDQLGTLIQDLHTKNDNLLALVDENSATSEKDFLLQNFYGFFDDEESALHHARKLSLTFPKSGYIVGYIGGLDFQKQHERLIIHTLEQLLFPNILLYYSISMEEQCIFISLGIDDDAQEFAFTYLDVVMKTLKNTNKQMCTIGIGDVVHSIADWNISLKQAKYAYHSYTLLGKGRCIPYRDVYVETPNKLVVPERELTQSLIAGDYDAIDCIIEQFKVDLDRYKPSKDQLKLYGYLLMHCIADSLTVLNQSIFRDDPIPPEHFLKLESATIVDALDIFTELAKEIVDTVKKCQSTDLYTKICAYINRYYLSPDFSINVLAEEMHLSPSQLSKFFKQRADSTVVDYVAQLRIKKAQELLQTTSLSISEIAEQVGYRNANSFCRRFKQLTDVSPNAYREKKV